MKKNIALAALLISFSLGACGAADKNGESTGQKESVEAAESETAETESEPAEDNTTEAVKVEETTESEDGGNPDGAGISNPIRPVDSAEDFKEIGLTLKLPEDEERYTGISCSMIGEMIAQIQFYDEAAGSEAIARAGKTENGDISGIYYVFDDNLKKEYTAYTDDGTEIAITMQVTTENSDVHGVLASWRTGDILYTLWEDSARDNMDAAGETAVAIAENCAQGV